MAVGKFINNTLCSVSLSTSFLTLIHLKFYKRDAEIPRCQQAISINVTIRHSATYNVHLSKRTWPNCIDAVFRPAPCIKMHCTMICHRVRKVAVNTVMYTFRPTTGLFEMFLYTTMPQYKAVMSSSLDIQEHIGYYFAYGLKFEGTCFQGTMTGSLEAYRTACR